LYLIEGISRWRTFGTNVLKSNHKTHPIRQGSEM
jgi:hypothetical protein